MFGGYYADPATDCQQYSVCLQDPISPDTLYPVNFLCPNGTIFNQQLFNCDWWSVSFLSGSKNVTPVFFVSGSMWTARPLRACMGEPRVHLELQEDQEEERMQALAQLPHLALLMSALVQSPPAGVLDRGTQTALEMGFAA